MLWSSSEFGFCELPDAWSSGSSIMPQKKNPDAAELLRAKAPRVVAHLAALHGVMHALPLTYNKDLQEDKEHLFDAADTLELSLAAARGMLAGARFDRERMREAASDELIAATDVADLLVRLGMPFREAHGVVAGLVRERGRQRPRAVGADATRSWPRRASCWPTHEQEFRERARVGLLARVEGLARADRARRALREQLDAAPSGRSRRSR